MRIGGLDFPEEFLTPLRSGRLIVFAGAGVSMGPPANLPSFAQLTRLVSDGTGEAREENEPDDRFLGRLHDRGVDVHARASDFLAKPEAKPTDLHLDLLRLFQTVGEVRLVTTNFDCLFEDAAKTVFGSVPEVSRAPALPLGRQFRGIVHVHGAITHPHEIVLTDIDFGRAYLTDAWAARFIYDLFRNFTVLFVGYSHSDVVTNYLARALGRAESGSRFALVDQGEDVRRWSSFGVTAIAYQKPAPGDYSGLYNAVAQLAKVIRRGILDWQREISELAAKPPSAEEETAAVIEMALRDEAMTRFFVDHARSSEWLTWLDARKLLDPLFGNEVMARPKLMLAHWLATHFVIANAAHLWALLANHKQRLNRDFWSMLCREIARSDDPLLDQSLLSRWVSILLECAPSSFDDFNLEWLAERCAKTGATQAILVIFDRLTISHLILKEALLSGDDEAERAPRFRADLQLGARHHGLQRVWETGLKPQIGRVSNQLVSTLANRFEQRRDSLLLWNAAGDTWDSDTWSRSAIEAHPQDKYADPIDVLIDAARDSLEWLVANDSPQAQWWIDRLVASRAPILRRLAIHAQSRRMEIPADEKIAWMISHGILFDRSAHHEAYVAVKEAYRGAGDTAKRSLIEAIRAYRLPVDEETEEERYNARIRYDWLNWLAEDAPDTDMAKRAFAEAQSANPDWRPKNHPDFTHYVSAGWVGPETPRTAQQLLATPVADVLPFLLAFKGEARPFGPDRNGVLLTVSDAAKTTPSWGIDLARVLAQAEHWDSDIWPPLLRAWSEADQPAEVMEEMFALLVEDAFVQANAEPIAMALCNLVRDEGRPHAEKYLDRANLVARKLWPLMDRTASDDEEKGEWVSLALNRAAGNLALFWVNSISTSRKRQEPRPSSLAQEVIDALTDMVTDLSVAGGYARAIFASQLAFFLAVDREWARTYLVPLFGRDASSDQFQQAWDGFLTWGRLTPPVTEALEPAFLYAVTTYESSLARQQDRFVEFYTVFLAFHAADPVGTWIPLLFKHGGANAASLFAAYMEHMLRGASEQHQQEVWGRWLKRYWENRLVGVPRALAAAEVPAMLEWLPHLAAVFEEAVTLATRMPVASLERSLLLHDIKESELPQRHPEATCRLLLYLGRFEAPPYVWGDLRPIADRIQHTEIQDDLKRRLAELLLKLGI
jgi:hypothetical protein